MECRLAGDVHRSSRVARENVDVDPAWLAVLLEIRVDSSGVK